MPRLFGTNGVRGVTNEDMNVELACNLGMAIGTYFHGRIVIGTDTRTSNQMLKSAVISGLLSTGCDVIDVGIVPSPCLQYSVKLLNANAGVIITASHNPPEFNGIKVIDGDGTELPREKEEKIEDIYFGEKYERVGWEKIGKIGEWNAIPIYINAIKSKVDVNAIKNAGLKVILDCGNGAGCLTSPYLLRELGCEVVTLNCQPDGLFPGRASEPSPQNCHDLINTVKSSDADIGIALDGDADRAIFIDEEGNYLHGDVTLAITASHMVSENNKGKVATPVSTSSCVEDIVEKNGGEIVYTKVGSPIVARKMIECDAIFGGEENGGLIFPQHQYCRDAAMASAVMLQILSTKKSLSQLVEEVPKYSLYKTKVGCPNEKKREAIKKFIELAKEEAIIKKIDLTDGAKIYFDDKWVLVRPSGTELIFRIFAEGKSVDEAEKLAKEYKGILEQVLE